MRVAVRVCVLAGSVICLPAASALAQDPPVIRMVIPLPPPLPEEEKPAELICSTPAVKTGSRINQGTKICKTAREWNDLHARGLDIGPDGAMAPLRKSNDVGACGLSCK